MGWPGFYALATHAHCLICKPVRFPFSLPVDDQKNLFTFMTTSDFMTFDHVYSGTEIF